MATYNYTVTASGNSYYLWNGHGLVDAQNPDLFFRAGDSVTITNASGGHPMRITNNAAPSVGVIDESGGQIVRGPVTQGTFTYFCTSHPSAMMGAITVSAAYANEGPEDGYGTGPLIGHDDGPLSMNEIRTKINEIITKGGVGTSTTPGGGSISVSENAPGSPSDGDLWWDLDTASLYVYLEDRDAWIQTNGAVGGGANFSTGWVNTDKNGVAIAVNTRLDFDHNLGTTDIIVKVYQANDINGTEARDVSDYYYNANNEYGARVYNITDSSLSVEFGAAGDYNLNLAAVGTDSTTSLSNNYIKVVVSAGGGGGGGGGGTPAGSDRQLQFNDNGTFGANADLRFDGSTAFIPRLAVGEGNFAGDEGGEVALRQSETNNTLAGNWMYMDSHKNLIRFFEGGPPYKGAYIDLSECADGVGTNLLAGGGGNASIKVQPTAPLSPSDKDLWFNSTQAELYVYVDAESAWIQTNGGGGSGGGNFSTGWVGSGVENGATLTFNHNLGTTDLVFTVYAANDANGTDSRKIDAVVGTSATVYGSILQNINNQSFVLQLAQGGFMQLDASGNDSIENFSQKYIKVVASAGGGGSGPRAHVSFDGKDPNVNSTMANVFNVSLITDNGTGNYTVTFANPISNPVVSATIASDQTYAQNPYPKESKIAVFETSSTSVQVRTGRGSYSAIDCPVHLVVF